MFKNAQWAGVEAVFSMAQTRVNNGRRLFIRHRRPAPFAPWTRDEPAHDLERKMLYTLAVILLIAWLLGVVGTYTLGAFVHVLLVVAIVLFVLGLLGGRRSLV
jgi:hypothetical protein